MPYCSLEKQSNQPTSMRNPFLLILRDVFCISVSMKLTYLVTRNLNVYEWTGIESQIISWVKNAFQVYWNYFLLGKMLIDDLNSYGFHIHYDSLGLDKLRTLYYGKEMFSKNQKG